MQFPSSVRLPLAVSILAAGGAFAAHLVLTPLPSAGPDPEALRRLAAAFDPSPLVQPTPGVVETAPAAPRPAVRPAPAPRRPAPPPAAPALPEPVVVPTTPLSPIHNLALMGVTSAAEGRRAWLVNLVSHEREVLGAGGSAWGVTVREVGSEHVVLAAGGADHRLRLGQKQIPTRVSLAAEDPAPVSAGSGSSSSSSRFRDWIRAGGGSRSYGSSSRGRSSSSSYSWRASSRDRDRDRDRDRGRDRGRSSLRAATSALPFAFAASRGMSGRAGAGAGFLGTTANPQTARRTGEPLVGDAEPLPEPEPIQNPQTQRRLGTAQRAAFGTATPSGRGAAPTARR